MKKLFLAITGVSLCLTLVACGTSQTDATINNLSNQLDETSNAISNLTTSEITSLNMSKDDLESLATQDDSVYDNVIMTQQNLLNEEFYKNDILNKTAKLKNCLSKDIKLSKAQSSAVKELANNLGKYTNSISYTKSELNSAMRSVNSLKKNTTKNAEKINAKLNRIICNSNTRSAYYQNILTTLNRLENYICCEDCAEPSNNQENLTENTKTTEDSSQTNQIETDNNTQTNSANSDETNDAEKDGRYGLPYNIDTYGPTSRRNLDTYGGNYYNNRMYNRNYGYNNAYNAPMTRQYQPYPAQPYPNQPYPAPAYYRAYNSNNVNRLDNYSVPVAETENTISDKKETKLAPETLTTESSSKIKNIQAETNLKEVSENSPRLEDYEEIKDGKLTKIAENSNEKAIKTSTEIHKDGKSKKIEDNRKPEEIKKDLEQPIKAH